MLDPALLLFLTQLSASLILESILSPFRKLLLIQLTGIVDAQLRRGGGSMERVLARHRQRVNPNPSRYRMKNSAEECPFPPVPVWLIVAMWAIRS